MNKQARILHLSSLALSRGGIETFLTSLTGGLSSQYDMVVASAGNQYFQNKIYLSGGRTTNWMPKSVLDIEAFRGFLEILKQERPSLVHIHDSRAGWIARLALATKRIPVIITVHLPSYYYRRDRFPKLWRVFYAVTETLLNRLLTTNIIYPSSSGYQYALNWGIAPARKAVHIPNGIDTSLFSINETQRNSFRSQMGAKPEQPIICALGRLSVEKNFSLIINAFAKIQATYPAASLWIAGDGPERMNLERQVAAQGLGTRVRFLGGNIDVGLTLAACDIFAVASWYEGGRTLAVMEAQVSGKPCVVSNVGDLPQMVEDEIYGFVFPEGNINICAEALGKLLANAPRREQMGQAAREKAIVEYGLDKMVVGYDRLYKSLIRNKDST